LKYSFLPIQCTEHWLRYIKEYKKPETEQDFTQKFEEQKKKAIKNNLYGNKNRNDKKEYLLELCTGIDVNFLSKQSESFKHFVESVKAFLDKKP